VGGGLTTSRVSGQVSARRSVPRESDARIVYKERVNQFEPDLTRFNSGLAELHLSGTVVGHVATEVSTFRTPCRPFRRQPWVWLVVVWQDGTKERSVEDYPPWSYVEELSTGRFEWINGSDQSRHGTYEAHWLGAAEASEARERLGITLSDF